MSKSGPKLLDASAKLVAEFDFEGLLLLMGVEPGAKIVKIEEIEREITLPQMRIDHGAKLTLERREGRVVYVVEFLARWKASAPLRLRLYCRAAEVKHKCPVNGILAVCTPFGAPSRVPSRHSYGTLDRHPFSFDVFCPWKIEGGEILAMKRPHLLPLVALARRNPENVREARRRLRASRHGEDLSRLRSFASVYYSQEQILELFGEEQSMIDEVILQESAWFQGLLKQATLDAREQARREALDEGGAKALRDTVRAFLAKRFPDLAAMPEVNRLGPDAARAALLDLVDAPDTATARKIVKRHAPRPK